MSEGASQQPRDQFQGLPEATLSSFLELKEIPVYFPLDSVVGNILCVSRLPPRWKIFIS